MNKSSGSLLPAVEIRPEKPKDHQGVYQVNRLAFGRTEEADLVDTIRALNEDIIALVAAAGDEIIGHIMLTPVDVQYNPFSLVTMGLGPIAVTPEFQRFGIGSRLIRVGINRCRIVGCQVIFVLGHSDYYPKFGFKPSSDIGCFYKSHDFDSHFFYLEVTPGAVSDLSGEVRYLPPFDDA